MYYEEKLINGAMCWRSDPNGEWVPMTLEGLTDRYVALKAMWFELKTTLDSYFEEGRKRDAQAAESK